MPSSLLSVNALSKCYRVYPRPIDRFKEIFSHRIYHKEFWALKDVSFTLPKGVSLGVLGENGAGKSTLLKLITGVLTPTSGTVSIDGRVASILELGTGFHPDFSGMENLFVGGALLGFSRKEMEEKLPEIVAFSELGEFLRQPLRSYSTGMGMRLSFSLAVSVDPDVLIVDEALAVGDGYFQKKCIDRIRTFQENGGSVLLCSHALYSVNMLCQEAIWLRNGQVEAYGPTVQVVNAYETYLHSKSDHVPEQHWRELRLGGEIEEISLEGGGLHDSGRLLQKGDALRVHIRWKSDHPERLFHVGIAIDRIDNLTCFATTTLKDGHTPFSGQVSYEVTVCFPHLLLNNGSFRVVVFLFDEHGVHLYYQKVAEQTFTIATTEKEWGIFYLDHIWQKEAEERAEAVASGQSR
ncbi:MAG: ABC transporter ATP-binding protein [Deltaproteobacteria bacterium]|nr:ABC transporter ATP-binding protein [Deltaproteobacteria bacterium]